MKIYSVKDDEFRMYGRVINDDFSDILEELSKKECPKDKTIYVPDDEAFHNLDSFEKLRDDYYGKMPIQCGYCNGYNRKLNCLEYHMDSEINVSNEEFILILGLRWEIENGKYDTSLCKAFRVPPKTIVEVYATSLHYAPVGDSFKCLVVLPKGTNVNAETSKIERTLFATNKWLLAHPESSEAKNGAYVGLTGENIEL